MQFNTVNIGDLLWESIWFQHWEEKKPILYETNHTSMVAHHKLTKIDTSTVLNGFKINNATVKNQTTYIYKGDENASACACDLIIAKW